MNHLVSQRHMVSKAVSRAQHKNVRITAHFCNNVIPSTNIPHRSLPPRPSMGIHSLSMQFQKKSNHVASPPLHSKALKTPVRTLKILTQHRIRPFFSSSTNATQKRSFVTSLNQRTEHSYFSKPLPFSKSFPKFQITAQSEAFLQPLLRSTQTLKTVGSKSLTTASLNQTLKTVGANQSLKTKLFTKQPCTFMPRTFAIKSDDTFSTKSRRFRQLMRIERKQKKIGHKKEPVEPEKFPLFSASAVCDFTLYPPQVQETVKKLGISKPTTIQELTWKSLQEEGDVVIHSPTGTGKTLAFLLPLLQKCEAWSVKNRKLRGIIIVPSRELGSQIAAAAEQFVDPAAFRIVTVFGDGKVHPSDHLQQLEGIAPNLIIATPDRLLAISNFDSSVIHWRDVVAVAFDEADKLFRPLPRYPRERELRNYKCHPRPSKLLLNAILEVKS